MACKARPRVQCFPRAGMAVYASYLCLWFDPDPDEQRPSVFDFRDQICCPRCGSYYYPECFPQCPGCEEDTDGHP
jgi:hypothetical protein